MGNIWREIWGNRSIDMNILQSKDEQKILLELKRCNGFDVLEGGKYEGWIDQYLQIKNDHFYRGYKQKNSIRSVYEVGCGCGANLYLFEKDGMQCGGIDYSEKLISYEKEVLCSADIVHDEAINLSVDTKYDVVFSNAVFHFFSDEKYALEVLAKMYEKARYAVGIIDLRDKDKEEDFFNFRRKNMENYEERYAGLTNLFYPKQFFLEFASKQHADIKFTVSDVQGYWNNDFAFNCYIYKR